MSDGPVSSDSVSRETAPPAPELARGVFGSRLDLATTYADLLAGEATVRGLIGPREVPRLWERHLLNCALVADLVPEGARVVDVGSGAGLPGLVLALRRPDLHVTLLEPLLRRTTFLELAASRMELDNVTVHRGRAEEVHGQMYFDVVTSRAVAPLDRLGRWSLPLVERGGAMLAMKGSSAPDELAEAERGLRKLGARRFAVHRLGAELLDPPVTVVEARLPA